MQKLNQYSSMPLETKQVIQAERLFSLGTLVGGIIHEINNPLNAILMNAELGLLILEQGGDRDNLIRILRTIGQEAKRGGAITRNIAEFAKSSGHLPKGPGNLNEAIAQARKLVGSLPREFSLNLELQLDTTPPKLSVNETALAQAIAHLITNAAQAGASQMRISTEAGATHMTLRVIDNGSGIAADAIEHIFEPFFTTWQEHGHLGLGLSLARRIIADHHGTINVQSSPETGACFVVRLPLEAEAS